MGKKVSDDDSEMSIVYEDEELMEDIMNLSSDERTFLEPFTSLTDVNSESDHEVFALDDNRIYLIKRLLEVDEHLVAMHTRMSGRSSFNEVLFWRNYFSNCKKLRSAKVPLMQDVKQSGKVSESSIGIQDDKTLASHSVHIDSLSDSEAKKDEDSSFVHVIPSAPNSLNTTISTKSLEDMVLIRNDACSAK